MGFGVSGATWGFEVLGRTQRQVIEAGCVKMLGWVDRHALSSVELALRNAGLGRPLNPAV